MATYVTDIPLCANCTALQTALIEVGENPEPEEIAAIIGSVDKNGDGQIDYEEFCIM